MKKIIKERLRYRPLRATATIRELIDQSREVGAPSCPPDEGDLLYLLAGSVTNPQCLEIGFATGSTALYLLLGCGDGSVQSIDYRQADYNYLGVRNVAASGMGHRHTLVEGNTNLVLPDLLRREARFDLIFMDGWKTFDHLWVDIYYSNQLLKVGGTMVFDDSRMESVHCALNAMVSHYAYEEIDIFARLNSRRSSLWYLLTSRSFRKPYRAFLKTTEYDDLPASRDWTYWKKF